MSDESSDNALGFLLLSTMLLAFTFGIDVGESLTESRHCEALPNASSYNPPEENSASLCRAASGYVTIGEATASGERVLSVRTPANPLQCTVLHDCKARSP